MKVLIVDDHELIRKGINILLSECDDVTDIFEAKNGTEAIAQVNKYKPDIVLLDISMPDGLDGFAAANHIMSISTNTKIIFLTMHDEEFYIKKSLQHEVQGYLLKNSQMNEIIQAIRAVYRGQRFYRTNIPEEQLERFIQDDKRDSILTPREKEVVQLSSLGYTNIQIGKKLNISPKTVENHKTNIMRKLNLTERYELIQYAIKNELVDLP